MQLRLDRGILFALETLLQGVHRPLPVMMAFQLVQTLL